MRRSIFFLFFLLSAFAGGQTASSPNGTAGRDSIPSTDQSVPGRLSVPDYHADFAPVIANGVHSVSWGNGHLVSFSIGAVKEPIASFDRTGKWLFEDPIAFEGAVRTYVQDAAVTASGDVVVAASVVNADGASADLLAEVTRSGVKRVIRTSPFYPLKVCSTAEGIVWAYGKELNDARSAELRTHYSMLREYSFDKGEIRSVLDRGSFRPPQGVPVSGVHEEFQMKCNAQKVVLVSGPTRELIQYDLATSQLRRWPMVPLPGGIDVTRITGAALTDSGKVYVSTYDAPNLKALTRILQLEVNSSGTADWLPVAAVPSEGKWFVLVGSEGESLVYSRGRRNPTLFWSKTQPEVVK